MIIPLNLISISFLLFLLYSYLQKLTGAISMKAWKCNFGDDFGDDFGDHLQIHLQRAIWEMILEMIEIAIRR